MNNKESLLYILELQISYSIYTESIGEGKIWSIKTRDIGRILRML